ncbi:hypothetical protein ACNO5E_24520 [Vibrio parahaemolyticus]|uniref:hypothetical protein n=1 Tax=Vibrio parahaemolyticus TaxID=670 RepID=UPI000812DBCB|nr:hypothetical protein [Vibrio parahaemolyticus]OCP68423.1 hypothetical protein AKH08_16565 [Vibrio parahaemolyticus]
MSGIKYSSVPSELNTADFISRGTHTAYKRRYWNQEKQGYRIAWALKEVIWIDGEFKDKDALKRHVQQLIEKHELSYLSREVVFSVNDETYCYIATNNQYTSELGTSHQPVMTKAQALRFIESLA